MRMLGISLAAAAAIGLFSPARAGEHFDTAAATSFMLGSEHLTVAIHKQSGHIKGIWETRTGRRITRESYDTYFLENRGGSNARRVTAPTAALLKNSSFEDGLVDAVPAAWRTAGEWQADQYAFDPAGVSLDMAKAYSGEHSVRLDKKPADKQSVSIWQRFRLAPGQECRARIRFQADIKRGGLFLTLLGEDERGNWVELRAQQQFPIGGTGDEWQEMEITTRGTPDIATMRAGVLFWDDQSEGTAWIDDFTCELVQREGAKWRSAEKDDVIQRVAVEQPDHLVLECANADIPGATLVKRYGFADVNGEHRILCRRLELSGRSDGKTLLSCRSHTEFDPGFRAGSWYHYVFPQGAAGNQRPLMTAEQIRRPIARRDHGTDDYGRAMLDAWNPELETGFAQYLYLANGRWEYPRGFAQTYWTKDGWQIGMSAMFINEEPVSRETRYHLFYEDRLQIHYEYMDLPEFKALRDESAKRVWPRVLRCGPTRRMYRPGDTWGHHTPFPFEPRRYEGGYEWGVYVTGDDVELRKHDLNDPGKVTARALGKQYKAWFDDYHAKYPRTRLGLFVYRGHESEHTRNHPAWFVSGSPTAHQLHRFSDEVIEFLTDGLTREAAYLGLGHVYRDAAIETHADWDMARVWPAAHKIKYFKVLQEKAHKVGCFLWTNMRTGSVFYDAAYYENSGATRHIGKTWRDGADMDLMNKLYQIPGTVHVPLNWWINGPQANYRRYHDLCLMLAMRERGGPCAVPQADGSYPRNPDIEPYNAVLREILPARFARIGLAPAWWRALDTELEAYTLKLGDAYLVNAISHYADTRDIDASVDLRAMGFAKSRPVFMWTHRSRQMLGLNQQYPDELLDQQYTHRTFKVVTPGGRRLRLPFEQMPPEHVWVTVITQVPAFIFAADGIPTQTLLPETLECRLGGELESGNRSIVLRFEGERSTKVLAYWPHAWGAPRVTRAGEHVPSVQKQVGGADFVLFDLAPGAHQVTISGHAGLSSATGVSRGRTLRLLKNGPVEAPGRGVRVSDAEHVLFPAYRRSQILP